MFTLLLATILKNVFEKPIHDMRNILYLAMISIFLMSCEKTVPDPYPIHDPDPSKFYANQTILDSIAALSIAFDSEGTAWIGTTDQGLIKYGLTQTKVYNWKNSIISNYSIRDIAIDSKNNVWIAADGLIKYDGEKFYRYSTANSNIPGDHAWSIAVDSNDDVWIASFSAESAVLAKYNGETFEVFTPDNSPLPIHHSSAIAIDNEENVWVATTLGVTNSYLIKISGESWTVYDSVDFKQNIHWVLDIDINSRNQVCGVIDYQLPFTRYYSPNMFCFDGINMDTFGLDSIRGFQSILVDDSDNFWCTYHGGYACFNGEEWNRTESETIFVNGYSQFKTWFITIEQAPDGNIWVATGDGIRILEGIE